MYVYVVHTLVKSKCEGFHSRFFLIAIVFCAFSSAVTVLAFTVPALYEKYDDVVNEHARKVDGKFKELFKTFDDQVLSKIPKQKKLA